EPCLDGQMAGLASCQHIRGQPHFDVPNRCRRQNYPPDCDLDTRGPDAIKAASLIASSRQKEARHSHPGCGKRRSIGRIPARVRKGARVGNRRFPAPKPAARRQVRGR
ncbi:hypothetical protein, partial [Bradyrhizobium macuxiense]|uniref:hypothetical protein n=1 Tax=Bradyrhizobium macuxiense TaxID=1755647 RepID=UPI001AECE9A1